MSTAAQERWMRLIEMLNSDEFGYPCSWFENAGGEQLPLMASRTVAARFVPASAHRMRIDAETWVRGDDWIREDIQNIYHRLHGHPEYRALIREGRLYIELTPVNSIKATFATVPSDDLRQVLDRRDLGRYSNEAFAAAEEVLAERARGQAGEPAPLSEQCRAAADARLRHQVRIIGAWYYAFAGLWLAPAALYIRAHDAAPVAAVVLCTPAGFLWLLGFRLRRFSPGARVIALLLGLVSFVNFPLGTLFGYYCYDKLTRGAHLFGVPGHPNEMAPGHQVVEPGAAPGRGPGSEPR